MQSTPDIPNRYPKFEVTEGTRALDARCKPSDLAVDNYLIPNALPDSEYKDLAARIIRMGQTEGRFVASSISYIHREVLEEIEEIEKREAAQRARHENVPTAKLISTIRRGFLHLMDKAVAIPEEALVHEAYSAPLTLKCRSDNFAFHGIVKYMVDQGYLNHIRMVRPGYLSRGMSADDEFLEPTEKLVEAILAAQRNSEQGAS